MKADPEATPRGFIVFYSSEGEAFRASRGTEEDFWTIVADGSNIIEYVAWCPIKAEAWPTESATPHS